MKLLDGLKKKSPKDKLITLRVNKETDKRIKAISEHYNISISDFIEHIVEKADSEFKKTKKK